MPFKSHRQSRLFFAKARAGEIPLSVAKEWASKTDYKHLPEKVRKKKKRKKRASLSDMFMPGHLKTLSEECEKVIPTKFGPGTGFGNFSLSPTRSRIMKPTMKLPLKAHAPENAVTSPIKLGHVSIFGLIHKTAADLPGGVPAAATPNNSASLPKMYSASIDDLKGSKLPEPGPSTGSVLPAPSFDFSKADPQPLWTFQGKDQNGAPIYNPVNLTDNIDPKNIISRSRMELGQNIYRQEQNQTRPLSLSEAWQAHNANDWHQTQDAAQQTIAASMPLLRIPGAAGAGAAAKAVAPATETAAPAAASAGTSPLRWIGRTLVDPTRPVTSAVGHYSPTAGRILDTVLYPGRAATGQQLVDLGLRGGMSGGSKLLQAVPAATGAAVGLSSGDANDSRLIANLIARPMNLAGGNIQSAYDLASGTTPPQTALSNLANPYIEGWTQPLNFMDREAGNAAAQGRDPFLAAGTKAFDSIKNPAVSAFQGGSAAWTDAKSRGLNPQDTAASTITGSFNGLMGGIERNRMGAPLTPDRQWSLTGDNSQIAREQRALDFAKKYPMETQRNLTSGNPYDSDQLQTDLGQYNSALVTGDTKTADQLRVQMLQKSVASGQPNVPLQLFKPMSASAFPDTKEEAQRRASGDTTVDSGKQLRYAKMIDGNTTPEAPGPYAQWQQKMADISKTKREIANIQATGGQVSPEKMAQLSSAEKDLASLHTKVEGRALSHYEDQVIRPIREKSLPDITNRIQAIQMGLTNGQAGPEQLQELQALKSQAEAYTKDIAEFALRKSMSDGLVRNPQSDMPAGLSDFFAQANKREPVLDSKGDPVVVNGQPLTKPGSPLNAAFEKNLATQLAKQSGEAPTPEQVQEVSESMSPLGKVLILGGLGLGAVGLLGSMLGAGGGMMGLLGLLGLGAGLVMGPGGGNISSLLDKNTYTRGLSSIGSMLGLGGSAEAPPPPPPQDIDATRLASSQTADLNQLKETPEFKSMLAGQTQPQQTQALLAAVRPDQQGEVLGMLAGNPAMKAMAEALFSRRTAIGSGQVTNPVDMVQLAAPKLREIGINPNTAGSIVRAMANGQNPSQSDGLSLLQSLQAATRDPARLAKLRELPSTLRDMVRSKLTAPGAREQALMVIRESEYNAIVGALGS